MKAEWRPLRQGARLPERPDGADVLPRELSQTKLQLQTFLILIRSLGTSHRLWLNRLTLQIDTVSGTLPASSYIAAFVNLCSCAATCDDIPRFRRPAFHSSILPQNHSILQMFSTFGPAR
jgi:hypothetical protein